MTYQSSYKPMEKYEKVDVKDAPNFIVEVYYDYYDFFSDYPELQNLLGIYRNIEAGYYDVMFDDECTKEQWELAEKLIKQSNKPLNF